MELANPPGATASLANVQFTGTNGLSNGDTVFTMDGSGFKANNYLNRWSDPSRPLPLGSGWFFKNPNAPLPFTAVGDVYAGTNHLPAGFSACGSLLPLSGGLSGSLSFSAANGDAVFVFNPTNNSYAAYTYSNQWLPSEPQLGIGQACWVCKAVAGDWSQPAFLPDFGIASMAQAPLAVQTGQLNFFTFNATNPAFGQVFDTDATALSTNGLAQLYAGTNADDSMFIPIGVPVSFSAAANGYADGGVVSVPFVSGGQAVYAQVRAWLAADGASHEAASTVGGATGKSSLILLTAHATVEGNQPGLPPRDANIFPSFSLVAAAVSVPPVIQSMVLTNGGIAFTWSATVGRTYQLQYKTGLGQTNWINLGSANAATNTAATGLDPSPADPQRFYRILMLPPGFHP
jgi:hypothetical protein